jgi:type II secretory ATPase GspE/PulE/Tfp pilus assembly ATPase PilB-like protein
MGRSGTETAEIAVRAALTGHLVFSTLHTNDSVSSVARMLEMRVEPFLVASSLVCSIAQRLAQRLCRHCLTPEQPIPDAIRAKCRRPRFPEEAQALRAGCPDCGGRGFGPGGDLRVLPCERQYRGPGARRKRASCGGGAQGWRSLREIGWSKVQQGVIAISEQRRLTHRLTTGGWKEDAWEALPPTGGTGRVIRGPGAG